MNVFEIPSTEIQRVIGQAIAEDMPWGDVTTDALIPGAQLGAGWIESREPCIVAGLPIARAVFETLDKDVAFTDLVAEGTPVESGQRIAHINGSIATILRGERVALNFLQRLSGIATMTRRFVDEIEGTGARIVDTRKTTPGLRALEKYAVRVGGGHNHRYGLSDSVLIKDNHIAALRGQGMTLSDAILVAQSRLPHTVKIEVEAESLDDVREALRAGADAILLDNMTPARIREALALIDRAVTIEASGGITLNTVRDIAETGVHVISIGGLTHSVKAIDLALEMES